MVWPSVETLFLPREGAAGEAELPGLTRARASGQSAPLSVAREAGCPEPHQHPALPAGIVVSSSSTAATASEGTSSDSCLPFSAGQGPVGLGSSLATQGLLGTCSPVRLASPFLGAQSATPVLQAQGGLGGAVLLPVSFQEGRRASDTSLTQGEAPLCTSSFSRSTAVPSRCLCPRWQMASLLPGVGRPAVLLGGLQVPFQLWASLSLGGLKPGYGQ